MIKIFKLLSSCALLFFASFSFSETIQCKVVEVIDGDTIKCLIIDSNKQLNIGLWGLDAPELGQKFGQESKETLSKLILDRYVQVDLSSKSKHKRINGHIVSVVGVIYIPHLKMSCDMLKTIDEPNCTNELININLEMIKKGMAWCWWYKDYLKEDYQKRDLNLLQAEKKARSSKIGLWSQPNPLSPWDWRENYKGK